jgi:hypothetical protein
MSSPITLPPPPQPPNFAPFFQQLPLPTPPGGQSSPFSPQSTISLQAFANGVVNFNPTVVTSGATDFFNSEQTALNANTSLNALIQLLINANNAGLLNSSAITELQLIVTNPKAFVESVMGPIFLDTSQFGLPATLYSAMGSPNNLVSIIIGVGSGTLQSNSGSGLGVIKNSNASGTNLGSTTTTTVTGSGTASFSLPSAIRPFINALAGQNPGTPASADFWSLLNFLANFAITSIISGGGSGSAQSLINAFSQGGLFSNSVNPSTVSYFFPLASGNSFAQFIQTLLTISLNPGTILAECILTPPTGNPGAPSFAAQTSFAQSAWSFLGGQTKGSGQLIGGQSSLEPLVNVLFGTNPATSSSTDPFQLIWNIINNPVTYFKFVFPTTTFTGSSISPQQLIADMITNVGNATTDFTTLLSNLLPGAMSTGSFSSSFTTAVTAKTLLQDLIAHPTNFPSDFWNGIILSGFLPAGVTTLFSDFLNHPLNVPCDLLSLIPMSSFSAVSNTITQTVSLCNAIASLFNNLLIMGQNAFIGQGTQNNFTGLGDSLKYSSGWKSTAPWVFSGVNGSLQGDLGYALLAAATAINEAELIVSTSTLSGASFSNPLGTAGANLNRALDAPRFLGRAIAVVIQYVMQLYSAVSNIANMLNNTNIPLGPTSSAPGVTNLQNLIVAL